MDNIDNIIQIFEQYKQNMPPNIKEQLISMCINEFKNKNMTSPTQIINNIKYSKEQNIDKIPKKTIANKLVDKFHNYVISRSMEQINKHNITEDFQNQFQKNLGESTNQLKEINMSSIGPIIGAVIFLIMMYMVMRKPLKRLLKWFFGEDEDENKIFNPDKDTDPILEEFIDYQETLYYINEYANFLKEDQIDPKLQQQGYFKSKIINYARKSQENQMKSQQLQQEKNQKLKHPSQIRAEDKNIMDNGLFDIYDEVHYYFEKFKIWLKTPCEALIGLKNIIFGGIKWLFWGIINWLDKSFIRYIMVALIFSICTYGASETFGLF